MPQPFDAILFDFDGVLADSEPIHYEVWCEILAPYGFKMNWDHYVRHCVGISDSSRRIFFGVSFVYAAFISKFMPDTGVLILDFIKEDFYFCYLFPLLLLPTYIVVYINWLAMKFFKNN